MNKMVTDIRDFHEKFNISYDGPPRALPEDLARFRIKFIEEELNEYIKAEAEGDIVEMLDALVDMVYVILGTAYLQGLPFNQAWDEVHKTNMAKVNAKPEDNARHSTDIVKPEGWVPPDLKSILELFGEHK